MTLNVIFDLNGTMIDDHEAQFQAWKSLFLREGISISKEHFRQKIAGRQNRDILRSLLGRGLSDHEIERLSKEKEEIFRKSYTPVLIEGLLGFLESLKRESVPMAIATSAPPEILGFLMDHLKIVDYFEYIIDDTQVKVGKPDPSIYLEAAARLGAEPSHCLVFEDSLSGIASAKKAGMKVVGITTGLPRAELKMCDLIIDDYTKIVPANLRGLIKG